MIDLPDDGYKHYVCVEPGVIEKLTELKPHSEFIISETIISN